MSTEKSKRFNMTEEIKQFIEDNGLVKIQLSPASEELDLWECAGGHIWNFDMIKQSVELNKKPS